MQVPSSDKFNDLLLNGARSHPFALRSTIVRNKSCHWSLLLFTSVNRWSPILPDDPRWCFYKWGSIGFECFKRGANIFFFTILKDPTSSSTGASRRRYGAGEIEGGSGGRGGCRITNIPKRLRQERDDLSKIDLSCWTFVEDRIFVIILDGLFLFRRGDFDSSQVLFVLKQDGGVAFSKRKRRLHQHRFAYFSIFDDEKGSFRLIKKQNTDEGTDEYECGSRTHLEDCCGLSCTAVLLYISGFALGACASLQAFDPLIVICNKLWNPIPLVNFLQHIHFLII